MEHSTSGDKTVIVTGAGQAIGYEICRQLALNGANVLLNDIDAELANQAVREIALLGGNCIACIVDSSDQSVVLHMVEVAVDAYGGLDIAIANAGFTLIGDFLSYPAESVYPVLNTN